MKRATDIDFYIGAQIRKARRAQKLSQTMLGLALNLTYQQVQKYEQGKSRISASRLYRISRILGVALDTFFPARTP
jgi:transcriptional regulator with XRE-family HTH domain